MINYDATMETYKLRLKGTEGVPPLVVIEDYVHEMLTEEPPIEEPSVREVRQREFQAWIGEMDLPARIKAQAMRCPVELVLCGHVAYTLDEWLRRWPWSRRHLARIILGADATGRDVGTLARHMNTDVSFWYGRSYGTVAWTEKAR